MKCKISNFQRGVKKISKQAAKPCRLFQTSFNIKSPQPEAAGFFQYSKSWAFWSTMSLTFRRRTLVEFSFSASFMEM